MIVGPVRTNESQVTFTRIQRLPFPYTGRRPDLDDTVEATSDLASGPWTPLATSSGLLGTETTVTDAIALSPDTPRRFLRLLVSER